MKNAAAEIKSIDNHSALFEALLGRVQFCLLSLRESQHEYISFNKHPFNTNKTK